LAASRGGMNADRLASGPAAGTITDAEERANLLLLEAAVLSGAGFEPLGATARLVAADVIALAQELRLERSARVALQKRCETLEEIVGKAAEKERDPAA
jgi:hypothetical protein